MTIASTRTLMRNRTYVPAATETGAHAAVVACQAGAGRGRRGRRGAGQVSSARADELGWQRDPSRSQDPMSAVCLVASQGSCRRDCQTCS